MKENNIHQSEEFELDLRRLFEALVNKAWCIGIAAAVCAAAALAYTFFFVTPLYQSSAMFYVNNSSVSQNEASVSISSGDISASRGLVKSYIVILNTRQTLNEVIDHAGVSRTCEQVRDMISAEAVDDTEIFRVTVTSPDPQEAEALASAIACVLPGRICGIIEGTSAKVVETAVVASCPNSPSYSRNTVIGFLAGFALMAGYVILRELMDTFIHSEDDIGDICAYPVLVSVPGADASGSCDRRTKRVQREPAADNISFAAGESYGMLCTKLQHILADGGSSHVIGVSGAISGEDRSMTAVNLSCSMRRLGKRVLLMDCDMRRSLLTGRLPVKTTPGLSDFLRGQATEEDLIQLCSFQDDTQAFHVISSGGIVPNPMELLSSPKMSRILEQLRRAYDSIILNLPPVGEAGDALVVSGMTDGMLLVVRQNHCSRIDLTAALRQLEFMNVKILGVVFNCVTGRG